MDVVDRRAFLRNASTVGVLGALPEMALAAGAAVHEVAKSQPVAVPVRRIRFSVIGLDHYHIMAMTAAMLRGGGELVTFFATDPKQIADFRKEFGPVRLARSEDEIVEDRSIQLVLAAPVPDLRAPLGLRVMRAGKDYLCDKPGVVSLAQLADVRRVSAETKRRYAIMYTERLDVRAAVKAGELVTAGAIGKVVQTVNLAPHSMGNAVRPAWFYDPERFGGILTDIGSHQADQFLYYTGSTQAEVVAAQTGNLGHPQFPEFQDFGDMMLTGDGGTGYVRVDWFTPKGLGTWGDGRLFLLGTEGYIELRKYADPAGKPGGDHLFVVDGKSARYIDCSKLELPFGREFVSDVLDRTQVAQDQEQALLAAELVLKAQRLARRLPQMTGN